MARTAAFAGTSENGNIYVPVWITSLTNSNVLRYSFGKVAGKPTHGWRMTFKKYGEVWVQDQTHYGRLVRAHYPDLVSFPAGDGVTTSALNPGGGAEGNWIQTYVCGTDEYCEWEAGADQVGMDTLVVHYNLTGATSVAGEIHLVRGEEDTKIGDIPAYVDTYGYANTLAVTVTVDGGLQEGDKIRIGNYTDGSVEFDIVQVSGLWMYDSVGVASEGDELALIGTLTPVTSTASSLEMAHKIAPNGSTPFFIGAHHQGGTGNGKQTLVSETWTVDGVAWTFAAGYKQGYIVQTRTTKAYYDAVNTDLGTFVEVYTYDGDSVSFRPEFTPAVAIDGSTVYLAMFPLAAPIGLAFTEGPAYSLADQVDGAFRYLPPSTRMVKVTGVVPGCFVCMSVGRFTQDISAVFCRDTRPPVAAAHNQKFYWDSGPFNNSTAAYAGGWTFWIEVETDPGLMTYPLILSAS